MRLSAQEAQQPSANTDSARSLRRGALRTLVATCLSWLVAAGLAIPAQAAPTWLLPARLTAPGQSAESPQVAVDPAGEAVAVWLRSNGVNTIVEGSVRPAGGPWQAPVALSTLGWNAGNPVVGTDQGGDTVLVWQRVEGRQTLIEAVARDAAGPQLRSLAVPAAATVNQLVAFSVAPFDVWSAVSLTFWTFGDGSGASGSSAAHAYSAPGVYAVAVTSQDAVGNTTTARATVTIFVKAKAMRIVRFRSRRAFVKVYCPSTASCSGELTLIARVVFHRPHGRSIYSRRPIGRAAFQIPPGMVTTVGLRLTKPGAAAARGARHGLWAQLTGPGVRYRVVVLEPLR